MTSTELRQRLKALGWKQSDLARRAKTSQTSVSAWCTGKTPVPGWLDDYLATKEGIRQLAEQ
jgi:transcriptional regulator with XRE-family HTH domain